MSTAALIALLAAVSMPPVPSKPPAPAVKPPAAAVAGMPASTLIVLNKAEATAFFFDLSSGSAPGVPGDAARALRPFATLPTGDGPHEIAVSPDAKVAVGANYGGPGAGGNSVVVFDFAGAAPTVARTIDLGDYRRPHGLAWLPDSRHLLVTCEVQQKLLKLDVTEGKVVQTWPTGQKVSHMVELARSGRFAAVTNIGSGSVSLIDLAKEGEAAVTTVATAAGAEGLAISPDSREVWVCNNQADSVSIVSVPEGDLAGAKLEQTFALPKFPIRGAFTPDGKSFLASSAFTSELVVIDAKERREIKRVSLKPDASVNPDPLPDQGPAAGSSVPVGIVVLPDGTRAYISNTATGTVAIVDLSTFTVAGHIRAGKGPDGIAVRVTPAK